MMSDDDLQAEFGYRELTEDMRNRGGMDSRICEDSWSDTVGDWFGRVRCRQRSSEKMAQRNLTTDICNASF